jgi:thiamine biosynthesis lipoprotein
MGTRATLAVSAPDRSEGLRQIERVLRILEDTERELSNWRDDSLVSQLNRHPVGHPRSFPPHLCELLGKTDWWAQETDGAFDPAAGTLVVHGVADHDAPPNVGAPLLDAAGIEHLVVEPDPCTVTRRGNVVLDTGGFGKGEALDRVSRRLGDALPGGWMVDLGGQVAVSGLSSADSWPVGIAHPLDRTQTVAEFELHAGSLAVSGGSERDQWVSGVRVGHIVDPRSGRPVARAVSVVVWHEEALVADLLSTALYVMGENIGLAWAEARGIAVCFVSPTGDAPPGGSGVLFHASRAFRRRFVLP